MSTKMNDPQEKLNIIRQTTSDVHPSLSNLNGSTTNLIQVTYNDGQQHVFEACMEYSIQANHMSTVDITIYPIRISKNSQDLPCRVRIASWYHNHNTGWTRHNRFWKEIKDIKRIKDVKWITE